MIGYAISYNTFLAVTKQLYEWFILSLCPPVTPFSLFFHHRSIMKFSRVNNNDQSEVHPKGQGQRLKVKVTGVKTQLNSSLNSHMMTKWCKKFHVA